MSNRIYLEATTFVSLKGDETYGYRMFDDFDETYCNYMDALVEDDLDLLTMVHEQYTTDRATEMLDYVLEVGKPIHINDTMYEYDQYKHIFGLEEDE